MDDLKKKRESGLASFFSFLNKQPIVIMKQSQTSGSQSQVRVENKDNLDSRQKQENMVKKNHITHNEKEHHSEGRGQEKK